MMAAPRFTADCLAESTVKSEPVSAEFPVNRETNRQFGMKSLPHRTWRADFDR